MRLQQPSPIAADARFAIKLQSKRIPFINRPHHNKHPIGGKNRRIAYEVGLYPTAVILLGIPKLL